MTIIDSCIIIDALADDRFTEASRRALIGRARRGRLFAPDIVFSEVCLAYPDANTVKILFDKLEIELTYLDLECLHLAAASYGVFLKRNKRALRQQIRSQKRILPDFYIGALATIQGLPLLTRDLKRKWNLDFPSLEIVTP